MTVRLSSSDRPEIILDRFPAVLGRGAESSTRLDDRWLSRRHCEMSELDGFIYVRDLGSKHGTFVNGTRVREALVYPGDHLQIGLIDFAVAYEPSNAQVTASLST